MSLLDMLNLPIAEFLKVNKELTDMHFQFASDKSDFSGSTQRKCLTDKLKIVRQFGQELGLKSVIGAVDKFLERIQLSPPFDCSEVSQRIQPIRDNIGYELSNECLISIPFDKVQYWANEHPFGELVFKKWAGLRKEIEEASKAFAVERHTATVFHLMRVMEDLLKKLAGRLSATINLERTWGQILNDVDSAISNLPRSTRREKERHSKCCEIASYLRHVKDAWRNKTMHVTKTYDEYQARNILENVRLFAESLARL